MDNEKQQLKDWFNRLYLKQDKTKSLTEKDFHDPCVFEKLKEKKDEAPNPTDTNKSGSLINDFIKLNSKSEMKEASKPVDTAAGRKFKPI